MVTVLQEYCAQCNGDYIWRTAAVALDEAIFAVGEYMSFHYNTEGFLFFFQVNFHKQVNLKVEVLKNKTSKRNSFLFVISIFKDVVCLNVDRNIPPSMAKTKKNMGFTIKEFLAFVDKCYQILFLATFD